MEAERVEVVCRDAVPVACADDGGPLGPGSALFGHLAGRSGRIKGTPALGLVRVMRRDHSGRMPQFLDQLDAPTRRLVEEGITASDWYPAALVCALLRARDRVLPDLAPAEQVRLGREYFRVMARGYYGIFFRLSGPERLFAMASKLWKQFQTAGDLVIDDSDKGFVRGRITGEPANLEPGHTEAVLGAICEALVSAGAAKLQLAYGRLPPDTVVAELRWSRRKAAGRT